jgi:cell surface protein SprA
LQVLPKYIGIPIGILVLAGIAGASLHPGNGNKPYLSSPVPQKAAVPLDSPTVSLPYPISNPIDPTQTAGGAVNLNDPLNIQNSVEFDPSSNSYLFNSSVGGEFNYLNPSYMTLEEYMEYDFQRSMQANWQDIVNENTPKENVTRPGLKGVGGEVFGDIFGGNSIDIRPQGTAELMFGINSSRTDNPQLPEKQRRITTFDFNERIQLSVVGSIGEKLKLSTSYNTEATFDFENVTKLEYKGTEDEIIQEITAGNVSLPLKGALITGSQSLFGVKTKLRFGRLYVTSVFSQQRGKRSEIEVAGGAQQKDYEVKADNYEANRHYYLTQYFRKQYDKAMASLPIVNSPVNITRIEVWITNTNNTTDNVRNIVAFTDLGEISDLQSQTVTPNGLYPKNDGNNIYSQVANNAAVRGFVSSTGALNSMSAPGPYTPALHYEKIENARKLNDQEYTYNALLGYISLNQSLNNDEVLAVAFQYTIGDSTYQVGEFSTDGIAGRDALILKLLKPTLTNPRNKIWDLMMKNIYSIGAYQVNPTNFQLDIWYNNPATSVNIPFLPYTGVDDVPLIQILSLDKLNPTQTAYPDGYFDFVPINIQGNKAINGGTINAQNGRVIFTTAEPFGEGLRKKLQEKGVDPNVINSVVYNELYDSTRTAAQFIPEKNRFYLKGRYSSSVSSEISLNALNVPQGSVTVTAGGVQLVENQDYTVDYNLGRVKIINTGVLESGQPIKISLESNSMFNIQSKTMLGTRFDYIVSKDVNLGGTILNLTERPLTQKINYGDEPISNTVIGLDGNYRKDIPLLTKWIDKLPLIETKEMSSITASAEVAYLIPGNARAIGRSGTSYVDDFEGSQSAIDIRSFSQWFLSSTPKGQSDLFPEGDLIDDLRNGFNRAKVAWYTVDPLFFRNNNLTPSHIKNNNLIQHDHRMREVLQNEVFPFQQLATGTPNNIAVFDVAFYPYLRGQYNFDTDGAPGISSGIDVNNGRLRDPETRWGGLMRQLTTTDFEAANIEFIQFWVMDPFNSDADPNGNHQGGDLYFNLGNISEDILADSRKAFENGIPVDPNADPALLETTSWGYVPTSQQIVNAFDNNVESRGIQDVGLDLMPDAKERTFYSTYLSWIQASALPQSVKDSILADPCYDNYNYYRDDNFDQLQKDILDRYKAYNGMEGNSPSSEMSDTMNADGYPTSATTIPNVEDINRDNNLTESESYFQYKVSLRKNDLVVGRNFVTDKLTINDHHGNPITWYQFKIPVREPQRVVNGIQDFRSIRFIRMFMTDFENPVWLRFARLELIRGEWRRYMEPLLEPGEYIQGDPNSTIFNVSAVNVEQNGNRVPVTYVVPPGITREIDVASPNLRQLNEQSLSLEICSLIDGDARACFKNVDFDVRQYEKMKMFIHAETRDASKPLYDNDITVFVRLGTDFTDNYYEYEMPVAATQWGESDPARIWPVENDMEIVFNTLRAAKVERNNKILDPLNQSVAINQAYTTADPNFPQNHITVKGNPNLQGIKIIMIGVRNPSKNADNEWKPDDGLEKCVEVWVNELRLTDFNNKGGWAAQGRVSVQGADFIRLDAAGSISTPNWGSIEQKVSERQQQTTAQVDLATNIELGKLFSEKIGLRLPLYMNYSLGTITPRFDPLNPDILTEDSWSGLSPEERTKRKAAALDYTRRRAINLTNISKQRPQGKKVHVWDIENLSLNFAYNEVYRRDINTEYNNNRTWRGGLSYIYNNNPKNWTPFAKVKLFGKSKWFGLIKDFNINLGPKMLGFNNDLNRSYIENLIRSNFANITKPQYTKMFNWNRTYDFKYDISKSLKFDYNAMNMAVIGEPVVMGTNEIGAVNRDLFPDEYAIWKDSVMQSIQNFGLSMSYTHNMNVTYQLPLNKFPLTDWITVNVGYRTSYNWMRAPISQDTLGHTIQNSRNVNLSAQLNFVNFYNKIPYLRKINQKDGGKIKDVIKKSGGKDDGEGLNKKIKKPGDKSKEGDKEGDKEGEEGEEEEEEKKERSFKIEEYIIRGLMAVRNASFTYNSTDGTLLPGFRPESKYVGMDQSFVAPGLAFITGAQNVDIFGKDRGRNFAYEAAANGWLIDTTYSKFLNAQHTLNHTQNFNARATVEPFKGLRIELSADRTESRNNASNFRWSTGKQAYYAQNEMINGTVSYSTISIGSAFDKLDDKTYTSNVFEQLKQARTEVSALLAAENTNSGGLSTTESGYYDGYGSTQQDVMVGSFLTSYGGKSVNKKNVNPFSNIPLPNWRVTFDALSKIEKLKDVIQSFTITHGYRNNVNIGNYATNLQAGYLNGDPFERDIAGNFITDRQMMTVALTEQFSPLIGLDATWKIKNRGKEAGLITKAEFKKDRNVSLSLANNQITEIRGIELVIGSGYKFNDVPLPFKIMGNTIRSELNLRVDISLRSNRNITRKIVEDQNQITSGQRLVSIKSSADYKINKSLTVRAYYDRVMNKPFVSTSFPTANTNAGLALRFTLSQ